MAKEVYIDCLFAHHPHYLLFPSSVFFFLQLDDVLNCSNNEQVLVESTLHELKIHEMTNSIDHEIAGNLHLFFSSSFATFSTRFSSNFFIVFLKSSQIFSGFREFSFLHSFSNIPMNKCSLGIHQIELLVNS